MSKLTLEALQQRADLVATEDLLKSISGGTENACHDGDCIEPDYSAPGDGAAGGFLRAGAAIAEYFGWN